MKRMCQHCGKKEATFYWESNINGKVTQVQLCADCAKELGYADAIKRTSFNDHFFDLFSPSFNMDLELPEFFQQFDRSIFSLPEMTENKELKEKKIEEPVMESKWKKVREINSLKAELKKAVREENFERAIELRDEIKRKEET